MRDSIGYLARVSSVKISGRSTRPWIRSLCLSGSMSGTPECSRTKCRPFGVMMPLSRCSGVRIEPRPGRRVRPAAACRRARRAFRNATASRRPESPSVGRIAHPRLDRQPRRRLGEVARRIARQRQCRAAGEEQSAMQEAVAGDDSCWSNNCCDVLRAMASSRCIRLLRRSNCRRQHSTCQRLFPCSAGPCRENRRGAICHRHSADETKRGSNPRSTAKGGF